MISSVPKQYCRLIWVSLHICNSLTLTLLHKCTCWFLPHLLPPPPPPSPVLWLPVLGYHRYPIRTPSSPCQDYQGCRASAPVVPSPTQVPPSPRVGSDTLLWSCPSPYNRWSQFFSVLPSDIWTKLFRKEGRKEGREREKPYPNAGAWVSVVFLIQPRAYLEWVLPCLEAGH